MAIAGCNLYYYPSGVKINTDLLVPGSPFPVTGLPSNSDFQFTATNVDTAGNESVQSAPFTVSTLTYTNPGADAPVSGADATAIDAIVTAEMAASGSPGVAISLAGPRGKYAKAYGLIAAGGRALTVDDHFRIASATKSFTSTAVLRAIDAGLLDLTDKVTDFITGMPAGSNQITIQHMLQMRSGIYDYQSSYGFLIAFSLFPTMTYTDDAILLYITGQPLGFTPGTQYQYTNGNYVLLGMILKKITGRTPRDIITEDLLVPKGLKETAWPLDSTIPPPAGGTTNWNPSFFSSAGALTSTVGDMQKWAVELRDSTLISPASKALRESTFITVPAGGLPAPLPSTYGYGLGMLSTGTWLGHDGSLPGFSTYIGFDTVSGATFAGAENKQTATPVPLAIYSRIFSRIADYLYPGSMAEQDYTGRVVRPGSAVMSLVGGTPSVTVNAPGTVIPGPCVMSLVGGTPSVLLSNNKIVQPASAVMSLVGGVPGADPIIVRPAASSMSLTGGTPTVTLTSFTAFTEENLERVNRAIPSGASGCWVTLHGRGGTGGLGGHVGNSNQNCRGGASGAGGAYISRIYVPVSSMGSTYTTTVTGTAKFSAGSVILEAPFGGNGSGVSSPGAGGVATAAGITATGHLFNGSNGVAGGTTGNNPGLPGVSNTDGAGSSGGSGGSARSSGTSVQGAGGAAGVTTGGSGDGAPGTAGKHTGNTADGGDGGAGGGYTAATSTTSPGAARSYLEWV